MYKGKLHNYFKNIDRPLILDGAMGSLIQQRGFKIDEILWTSHLNIHSPNTIQNIHEEYINAGCDIITTNTFRTNPLVINKHSAELDINNVVKLSVKLSKEISEKQNVLLAGSNAPAEDCYQKERTIAKSKLEFNHKKHIELLFTYGADFILNETLSHKDEIKIICKYCSQNKIPFIISLFVTPDIKILSGEKLNGIIDLIKTYSPILILFNCITTQIFESIIKKIKLNFDWGFYLNCGSGNFTDKNIKCGISPLAYSEIVKSSLSFNPRLVGSCCGSNPNHIKSIKKMFDEKINN